jgi:hypothetical protein
VRIRSVTGSPAEIVVAGLPSDGAGRLSVPPAGQVVLSVPSPEALAAEPDEVRLVIDRAGGGIEPPVILVEEAESLREDELMPVLAAVVTPHERHPARDAHSRLTGPDRNRFAGASHGRIRSNNRPDKEQSWQALTM